jgi:ribosomal protein S18 acetylase RimI-like enzyme
VNVPVEALTASAVREELSALIALLEDAVASGASIGFLPPLTPTEASDYWVAVAEAVRDGGVILLAAPDAAGVIVGSAQVALERRPNGRHRAEVVKVMVHTRVRRQGIGRALMLAAEAEARRRGRTTLFLDTRRGDHAERLYRSVGWRYVGSIPKYARSANGALDGNAIYYKLLDTRPRRRDSAAPAGRARGRARPAARGGRSRP